MRPFVFAILALALTMTITMPLAGAGGDILKGSTYLGGDGSDNGLVIAADAEGYIYVAGDTYSDDFPATDGAYDTSFNGVRDIFVAKLTVDCDELLWSTYVGGDDNDLAYGIEVDEDGYVYVTGRTDSTDFPTTVGAYQETHAGGSDVVVFKLSQDGSDLVYSTFVGGVQYEVGFAGVAVDGSGNAYVAGHTNSPNFPTTQGAYDRTYYAAGWDGFAFKLSADGSDLVYSTYFGGWDYEGARDIAIDGDGHAYLTGDTTSNDFPTTAGAYDTTHNGERDNFILELDADGSDLVFSTFLGGSDSDVPDGLFRSANGTIWTAGYSLSEDFPTTANAYASSLAGGDGDRDFTVCAISQDGSELIYSTYIGGGGADEAGGITHLGGTAYVVGRSFSTDFPTTDDAFDSEMEGNSDMVFLLLETGADGLVYSTYVGGSGSDGSSDIVFGGNGLSFIGYTNSTDFPVTEGAYDEDYNGDHIDAAVVTIEVDGVDTGPWVTIDSPDKGGIVSGTEMITGTSWSTGAIEQVEVSIDSGGWTDAVGTDPWSYEWDTTAVGNGEHTISARAYDGEGYSHTTSITVTVSNDGGGGSSGSGDDDTWIPGFELDVVIISLVLVLPFIFLKRRS